MGKVRRSPLSAIRAKCIECMGDSVIEVKRCMISQCALYPFRFGKNPYRKRELTDEQRAALSERLRKMRQKQKEGE